jgi:alkylation response protein AidB-like acyl-CoA dehydrogenase
VNFDLDKDQLEFAAGAGEFYAEQDSVAQARRALDGDGAPTPGLKALADIGFYGITVPESAGGAGRGVLDLAVVAEQGGRFLASPSLVTAARAAVLLEGDDTRLAALAVVDGPASRSAASIDVQHAGVFLGLDGDRLVAGPGTVTAAEPLDPTRGLGSVSVESEVLRTEAHELWERARLVGLTVLAAEDLGTAARAVEIGVDYVTMRHAFGRPIGSYQAIKHALVDCYSDVEQLRSLVWWAAWAADEAPEELPLAASAAAAMSSRVVETVTETLIHVHGGIGFTWEHDAHLYWRRAQVDRLLLGDEAEHLDAVARISLRQGRS